ncbi:MAG TPA: hypothetical protein VEQ63_11375, partial [Bryobacteraceae bacterium]|nr:hypothetical protein [Bryobacteraceae bacterium]
IAPRALAPGMFISIYGTSLAPQVGQAAQPYPMSLSGVEVRANGAAIPVQYVSPTQINAVLSDTVSGVVRLTVRSPEGEHTLHALVEPAVPALVPAGVHALSGALVSELNPIRPGDYLSLYLTGLGTTERRDSFDWAVVQPQVTVGGRTCELLYAGRSFGYVGLDQINCRVAADAQTSNAAPVTVRSGSRSSNVINLPLR